MTHFHFLFSSNKCTNYTWASAKYQSSLEVSKSPFVKAQLYGLVFANATFSFKKLQLAVTFCFYLVTFYIPYFLLYFE